MPEQKPIKCPACETLFGIEIDNVLNIKHRDLFRRITGTCTGPCRRCGNQITWSSNDDTRPRPTREPDFINAG